MMVIEEREIITIFGVRYYVSSADHGYPFSDAIPKTMVLERIYREETKDSN